MEKEISPVEDLYQEHGLLNRLLLIYDEIVARIENKQIVNMKDVIMTAYIIRYFIEDYHEKNEETFIFPKLLKCHKYINMVKILISQHKLGRLYTDNILVLSDNLLNNKQPRYSPHDYSMKLLSLAYYIKSFTKMYRAHESREDTVIFRAFRSLVSPSEYAHIGEFFEKSEDKLLGKNGYDQTLQQVEIIEKNLGIYDLTHYNKI